MTLRIGITGHRPASRRANGDPAFPPGEIPRITEQVAKTLETIAASLRRVSGEPDIAAAYDWSDGAVAELRLVSALAEGSDRIAAHAALALGWPLDVVLPFREDYAGDFKDPASLAEYDRLLKSARHVFALAMPEADAEKPRAYHAAGQVMLDNIDLLVAIWDGDAARGQGGTADVVAEARERAIPTFRLDPTEGGAAPLHYPPGGGESALPKDFDSLVRTIVAPPLPLDELERYYREAGPEGAAKDGRLFGWAGFANWFFAQARALDPHFHPVMRTPAGSTASGFLWDRYSEADAISSHLGKVYRSAFVTIFLLAAVAVFTGLLAILRWDDWKLKILFVTAELVVIGLIYWLVQRSREKSRAWHQRWLATRRLAELLRPAVYLADIGGGAATAPDPDDDDSRDGAWTEWYFRAVRREQALPNAVADDAYLKRTIERFDRDLLSSQLDYHTDNAAALRAQHHGLDRIGFALFVTTFGLGVFYIVYAGLLIATGVKAGCAYDLFKSWIKPLVTIASGALPAFGAALYGIRAQGDFETRAGRSEMSARALQRLRESLSRQVCKPDLATIRSIFAEASEIMQYDLSDWRRLYRHRPIGLPS